MFFTRGLTKNKRNSVSRYSDSPLTKFGYNEPKHDQHYSGDSRPDLFKSFITQFKYLLLTVSLKELLCSRLKKKKRSCLFSALFSIANMFDYSFFKAVFTAKHICETWIAMIVITPILVFVEYALFAFSVDVFSSWLFHKS